MNICFLSDGLAEHTRRWTRFFGLAGHDVHLITWNDRTLNGYDPVVLHKLEKRSARSTLLGRGVTAAFLFRSVEQILRENKIELVHAHSSCAYSWMGMATRFHPLVVTPWGTDLLHAARDSRVAGWLTRRTFMQADCITCDAAHMRDRIAELGVPVDKIKIIMFGVDLERFSPNAAVRDRMRQRFGLNERAVIISTRTHSPVHDIMTFVRAMPLVAPHSARPFFVVAADGVDRPKLEAAVDELGVRHQVHFTGYLAEDQMSAWLQAADVYVSPSLADAGLAASTAEAMALGIPAVVTDFGDNSLWVRDGGNGFLFPPGDSDGLAAHLRTLLDSPTLQSALGGKSRTIIEERNNYEKEMCKMEEIYLSLCRGRHNKF